MTGGNIYNAFSAAWAWKVSTVKSTKYDKSSLGDASIMAVLATLIFVLQYESVSQSLGFQTEFENMHMCDCVCGASIHSSSLIKPMTIISISVKPQTIHGNSLSQLVASIPLYISITLFTFFNLIPLPFSDYFTFIQCIAMTMRLQW